MLLSLIAAAVVAQLEVADQEAPRASCLSASGTTVCGYACQAASGTVKCAQTPQGACGVASGQVTCWDPPRAAPWAPPAQCLSASGTTVCGYACQAASGTVKCAQTPQGACGVASGQVTCWDPPRASPRAPPATCLSASGTTVCGYGCLAASGTVKCAQTPQGTCAVAAGAVTCWDPPAAPRSLRR